MTLNAQVHSFLRCPQCRAGDLALGELINQSLADGLICSKCSESFPVSNGCPVLIRKDNMLFRADNYIVQQTPASENVVHKWAEKLVPGLSVNLVSHRLLRVLSDRLNRLSKPVILVVGGGTQRKWLNDCLGTSGAEIVYSDIDVHADVDLFCDGHDLPFIDGCFDAVVTTAVLEHVMYPERVAEEITRVLKVDGLLYSELPFMQQVHEGAYDFTRYTLSGHRRLFNSFDEIDAGMVAGPGTALAWAIENFILAFFNGSKIRLLVKSIVRIGFSWVKYFDYLLEKRPQAMDGASCTYFLGRKMNGRISDSDIVKRYTGGKHLSHT